MVIIILQNLRRTDFYMVYSKKAPHFLLRKDGADASGVEAITFA